MDFFDVFDFLGDASGCCLISAAVLLVLLACAACLTGLWLAGAFS
jgi:hypothetical protein